MSSSLCVIARRATSQDASVLAELMREFHAEANYTIEQERAAEAFLSLLNRPELGAVWIALLGEASVGYVVLTLRYSMDHGGPVGRIEDFYVRATSRRRGAGSALLSELFEECRRQHYGAVDVEVDGRNETATNLYRRFGLDEYRDGRVLLHVSITPPSPTSPCRGGEG